MNTSEIPNHSKPPQYKILLHNGQESPILTQTELFEYARSGFIKPESLVYDDAARVWARADSIPPVLAVLKQTGRLYAPPPMPEPPRSPQPQQYQQPQHQMQAQYGAPVPASVIQFAPGAYSQTAAILCSILLCGLGQIVNRQSVKGIVTFLAALCLGVITGGLAALVIYILAIVDACCIANRLNRGEPVREWQFF